MNQDQQPNGTSDQLLEEAAYPNLAALMRSDGKLEVGEDLSVGTFAQIRKGNQTITVDATYRDFAALPKEMEVKVKELAVLKQSMALKRELAIKALPRTVKEALVASVGEGQGVR